jgi:tRNA(guanine-26,N2-N2) methyltransferase
MAHSGAYSRVGLDAATPAGHVRVQEGHGVVMMPPAAVASAGSATDDGATAIFYNKAQVVNRDLSVCVLETFARLRADEPPRKGGTGPHGITVLEALSATGLRALRYWHEVEGIRHILANDLDPEAVECIRNNCALNGVPCLTAADFNSISWPGAKTQEDRTEAHARVRQALETAPRGIIPNCDDAINLMHTLGLDPDLHRGKTLSWTTADGVRTEPPQKQLVDVVDLDPYGTASPFLESAVACAKEGALMLVTCTDSAILCGNYAETCHAKYGCLSARLGPCHEMAPRIVLALLERTANKHAKFIEPLISLHIDFYVRVVVRIRTQPAEVKLSVGKLAHVFHCVNCPAFHLKPLGRVRPSKQARRDAAGIAPRVKQHRTEQGANTGNGNGNEGADEDETAAIDESGLSPDPVSFPESLSRATPMHVTSPPIDDVPRRCTVCGSRVAIAGPIYAAPSQSPAFIDEVLKTIERKGEEKLKALKRVQGLLNVARLELPRAPLFYKLPDFASTLKMQMPPNPVVIGALCRLGYDKQYDPSSRATGVAKFVQNPAFWGPKARHCGVAADKQVSAHGDGR